jgi:hypothetical protein
VRHPGAVAAWLIVILLMVLMLVWAAHESDGAVAFVAVSLGLLIVVPLLARQPRR